MKLYLTGHDYKYAVEQMLLTLYPNQRPEYPEAGPEKENDERMELSLSKDGEALSAECLFYTDKGLIKGEDSGIIPDGTEKLEEERISQRLIKNAMYRAALASGHGKPAWGALTGVRPGKLLCGIIATEADRQKAKEKFISTYDVSEDRAELCMKTAEYTLRAQESLEERDICLYVGIPFCPTRCAYCSFVSQSVEKSMKLIEPFMDALMKEISATGEQIRALGLRPVSVYMGGGTPTTLSPEQLERLCSSLECEFDLSAVREYTVEAGRPDTITEEKLKVLRSHGVDRISVNPQTMSDRILEIIGRKHSAEDIISALETARSVGGFDVNMDLIAGLPGDSLPVFGDTVERVLALRPENITVHTLSLKKGSRITLEESPIPSGQEVSDMLELANRRLSEEGYIPYYLYRQKFMSGGFENVGWTLPEKENLYNICIMEELCSIVAMGGGGSTKLVKPGDARNIRIMAPKYPLEYINMIEKTCEEKKKIAEYYGEEI